MRSTSQEVRYPQPIDYYLYKEFNKDRTLNSFFKPERVGKCMQLIDDYYLSVNVAITQEGWKDYYLSLVNGQNLMEACNFLKEKYKTDLETATEYVYYRVIGQTWNGMLNEVACINELQNYFTNLEFRKTSFEVDQEYCTDWEAFANDKLLFGIQIKPSSYKYMSSPYQLQAKKYHLEQVEQYKERYGVGHFFVYHSNDQMEADGIIGRINTYLLLNIDVHL